MVNGFFSRKNLMLFFVLIMIFQVSLPVSAQKKIRKDSISGPRHSPKLATVMSAVIPGLGQVYNRKYWKPPVINAVFGVLGYFYIINHKEYKVYKNEYGYRVRSDSAHIDPSLSGYSNEDIVLIRDYYRRNVEITLILAGVWYVLNVIDANVDAHLFTYDISDNLSLRLEPEIYKPVVTQKNKFNAGLRLSLRF